MGGKVNIILLRKTKQPDEHGADFTTLRNLPNTDCVFPPPLHLLVWGYLQRPGSWPGEDRPVSWHVKLSCCWRGKNTNLTGVDKHVRMRPQASFLSVLTHARQISARSLDQCIENLDRYAWSGTRSRFSTSSPCDFFSVGSYGLSRLMRIPTWLSERWSSLLVENLEQWEGWSSQIWLGIPSAKNYCGQNLPVIDPFLKVVLNRLCGAFTSLEALNQSL